MKTRVRVRRPRSEDGFTLVEMITTIVIMGLVVVPLCTVMLQSLTLVPQSGSRTQSATDNTRLITQFEDDIAVANTNCWWFACSSGGIPAKVTINSQFTGVSHWWGYTDGGSTGTLSNAPGALDCLPSGSADSYIEMSWSLDQTASPVPLGPNSVYYLLRWTNRPAPAGYVAVDLVRRYQYVVPWPTLLYNNAYSTMASGFCRIAQTSPVVAADTNVAAVTVTNPATAGTAKEIVVVTIQWRDSLTRPMAPLTLYGTVRAD